MEFGIKNFIGTTLSKEDKIFFDQKEHYLFLFVKEEGVSVHLHGEQIEFPANSLIFLPESANIYPDPTDERELVVFHFTEAFFCRTERETAFLKQFTSFTKDEYAYRILHVPEQYIFYYQFIRIHLDQAKLHYGTQLYKDLAFNMIKQVYLLGAIYLGEGNSAQLMGEEESEPTRILSRFGQLIDKHVGKEKHVRFYAEQLNVTPRKLTLYSKQILGKTPKDIITDGFIRLSKKMLIQTNYSIKHIAWELGYTDENNFSATFSKEVKVSPSAYRKTWKLK